MNCNKGDRLKGVIECRNGMKDFDDLILCDYRSARVDVHVRAPLADGTPGIYV